MTLRSVLNVINAVQPSRLLLPSLSLTLLCSWGSLYYSFAMLAGPIQADMNWSATHTMGGYSAALLTWGLCAYASGRWVDRHGGRGAMVAGSCACALLLLALSRTQSLWAYYLIWSGLGAGMALTLYEPAFAIVIQAWPQAYRRRMGVLTLAGGLASTVFWPLTFALEQHLGWRHTVAIYAMVHLLVCAPLHALALPAWPRGRSPNAPAAAPQAPHRHETQRSPVRQPAFWLLVLSFTAFGFVTAALSVHVVPLLVSAGATTTSALAMAALIGPMQVAGRSADLLLAGRMRPLVVGWTAASLMPLALVPLGLAMWAAPGHMALLYAFALAYGLGLGLMTIVRATSPAELFGVQGYAAVSGALSGPSVLARAAGPLATTWMLGCVPSYLATWLALWACAFIGAAAYMRATRKVGA